MFKDVDDDHLNKHGANQLMILVNQWKDELVESIASLGHGLQTVYMQMPRSMSADHIDLSSATCPVASHAPNKDDNLNIVLPACSEPCGMTINPTLSLESAGNLHIARPVRGGKLLSGFVYMGSDRNSGGPKGDISKRDI